MRKLLNTLYITTPDAYLSLDGETIVIKKDDEVLTRLPLMNFESIVKFGYMGISPALIGHCVKNNTPICFLSTSGHFQGRIVGEYKGNVLLRKQQYRYSDDEIRSCEIAKNFLIGKTYNSRWIIERAIRDYPLRLDIAALKSASSTLKETLSGIHQTTQLDTLRGIEGKAATCYFGVFDQLILQQKDDFYFHGRNRRPPLDNVNAMLSFLYTLLAHDIASALETVGLDPYVGFLHRDRPGRISLALDLMEELRSVMVDRLVLTLINRKTVNASDFIQSVDGAVIMTDDARKKILKSWQEKKAEVITHPFLNEQIEWGLVPYVQALLLARYIRDDLDNYPPFMWK